MSYRYNATDIVVGVGMCAIVFGALLFFVAAGGVFQATVSPPLAMDQPFGVLDEMVWLQPALGQAIVDQTQLERRNNLAIAGAVTEWNRATAAHQTLQAMPGGPLGFVRRQAATAPDDHNACVQAVMGRNIVNFTKRGVHSGVFSADQPFSEYNSGLIRATQAMGQRMDHNFLSTWQASLGQNIVTAIQQHAKQEETIQEQLGRAILQMTHAQASAEEAQAAHQDQLASLVVAAIRTDDELADRVTKLEAIEPTQRIQATTSAGIVSWPEIPMGFLAAAVAGLFTIFLGGLLISAMSREAKALATMRRETDRWVYRLAA
jgi:hypothetical protein